jgi:two-component system nitrogen regulation response regulator GlnG
MGYFRRAGGGTLFLDEIGDMPVDLQAKLLRVLQSSEVTPVGGQRVEPVDARIIAATNSDLDEAVAAGAFREDLLYRLRVVPLHVPTLRERRDDIPILARHFIDRYAEELGCGQSFLTEATIEKLAGYDWPGNVRELENAIKRALVLASGEILLPEDFCFLDQQRARADLETLVQDEASAALDEGGENLYRHILERVERPLLETVLARTDGNQIRAAALLGMNRNTLRKKIVELGIELPRRR